MSITFYSSADFDITTSDVNIQETVEPARDKHVAASVGIRERDFNNSFYNVELEVSGNARTISGQVVSKFLNHSYSDNGYNNTRQLQKAYLEAIAISLYGAGATDSAALSTIGSSQILLGSGRLTLASHVSDTLFKNCFDLVNEAAGVFSAGFDTYRDSTTANGAWLLDFLTDMHENTGTRALLSADSTPTATDRLRTNLIVGDSLVLYFLITSDTDDGVLGTSRTDNQTKYSNPTLNQVRIEVTVNLIANPVATTYRFLRVIFNGSLAVSNFQFFDTTFEPTLSLTSVNTSDPNALYVDVDLGTNEDYYDIKTVTNDAGTQLQVFTTTDSVNTFGSGTPPSDSVLLATVDESGGNYTLTLP